MAVNVAFPPGMMVAGEGLEVTETVGSCRCVSTTSSDDDGQEPFEMVQRSVAEVPAGMPVTEVVAEELDAMTAVPLTTLQSPVPVVGVLAAMVKLPLPQFDWSEPALAVVGRADTVAAAMARFCGVALVDAALRFPEAPLAASALSLMKMVVFDTELPERAMVSVLP